MPKSLIPVLLFCLFHTLVVFDSVAQTKEHLDSLNTIAKSYACRQINKFDSIADKVIQVAKQHDHHLPMVYALKIKA